MSLPQYTLHHPRWYRRRMSTYWWMWQWRYLKFILRELSSLAVAWFVAVTLAQIWTLQAGPDAYAEFQAWLRTPPIVFLNGAALAFALFHTVTWFNLTPRAMVVRVAGKRLPDVLIALPNYIVWVVVSAGVAWILLRG